MNSAITKILEYRVIATEITCLQKNMVALENLAPSKNLENLAPPWPSEHSTPPPTPLSPRDSKATLQLLKSSPQRHIFFILPSFARRGGGCIL